MLSTHIYNLALNNAVANARAARAHGDHEAAAHYFALFIKLLDYARTHGLIPAPRGFTGQIRFRRNGYRPDMLHIEVE
jgi:hypothetical protein